jgi:hypothetical protein
MRFAYGVTTYGMGSFYKTTLEHIPEGSHVITIDNKVTGWPLAKAWNYIIDELLWHQSYDACIIMNDDVVLRPDTGELLAWALLEGQYEQTQYDNYWPVSPARPDLLLISARHASWSDACTDAVDWNMLNAAKPIWQPSPDFSCFVVSRHLGQVIGRFDEGYDPCYFEDNDTHRRIQLAGYEGGAFAPYWHFRNGTIRSDAERNLAVTSGGGFEKSKRYYLSKWGGLPGQEIFVTPFNR